MEKDLQVPTSDVTWEDATRLDEPTTVEPQATDSVGPVNVPEGPTLPQPKIALESNWDEMKTSLGTGDLKTDRVPTPSAKPPRSASERFGEDGTELDLNLWVVPSEGPLVQDWSEPSITKRERPSPSDVEITLPPAPMFEPQKLVPKVIPARPADVLVSVEIQVEAIEAARIIEKRTLEAFARDALASPTALPQGGAIPRARSETAPHVSTWKSNFLAAIVLVLLACAAGLLTYLIAGD
jgi:hypothetical protein